MKLLITDDESGARRKIRRFLEDRDDVQIAGEAADGKEALEYILDGGIDAVFLDIRMPNLDGFALIKQLPPEGRPLIVFATAYDEFAVKAFETNAVDYLLKPFDRVRFNQALDRLLQRFGETRREPVQQRIETTLDQLAPEKKYAEQFIVPGEPYMAVVHRDDIDWIEAAANYAVLHCGGKQHILRTSLRALEEKLEPQFFCRVHRQTIVNIKAVATIETLFKGDMLLHLKSGDQVRLSRRYRQSFFNHFHG